jgi:mono/diheme cytochrome c family protein
LGHPAQPAVYEKQQPRRVGYSSGVEVDTGAGLVWVNHPLDQPAATAQNVVDLSPRRDGGLYFLARTAELEAIIDPWNAGVQVRDEPFLMSTERFDSPNARGVRRFSVDNNPQALAFTPDGKSLLVACDPPGRGDRPICLIDLKAGQVTRRTIPGSSNLRGIAVDPEGRYLLATHLLPKSELPATQITQGWVFTNAISYVPLDEKEPIVTLPLDLRTQGFANPEGVAIAPDGKRAFVTHAGADVVTVIDLPSFKASASRVAATSQPIRQEGQPAFRSEDLSLPKKYVRARIPVGSNPRGVAVHYDNKAVVVFNRLDQTVSIIDADKLVVTKTLPLEKHGRNDSGAADDDRVRRGERLFYNGKLSFSGQFSCASCHPDGHTDGLNWDLPADGFNNFHNTKSLLGAAGTTPYGWNGASETLRSRFTGTLRSLFQYEPSEEEIVALEIFLERLNYPERLPRRVDPASDAAKRGRALFEGVARCKECHAGSRLADAGQHDVGTGTRESETYDTPSLIRIAETAPYLHDGRAESLEAIFQKHNPSKRHGNAASLDAMQLADLIEYLKSL